MVDIDCIFFLDAVDNDRDYDCWAVRLDGRILTQCVNDPDDLWQEVRRYDDVAFATEYDLLSDKLDRLELQLDLATDTKAPALSLGAL